VALAKKKRVKTVLQYNFEFLDYLSNDRLMLPDVLLAPSLWRMGEVEEKFRDRCLVTHLPPPTDENLFENNRTENRKRHNRLLHIGGKAAIYDRNGTNSVIDMLKYSKKDYELVVKTQSKLDIDCKDERLTILTNNEINREDLYRGYDAMILPRRYAGLCLPMNEALMSGLPVFMTDISPNNMVLPKEWLAESKFVKDFMARIGIQLYEAHPKELAKIVDNYFDKKDLSEEKERAFRIAHDKYSYESLKKKYIDLFESL
jgi:glycosyltransferase involved in cell wall biosynthesis